MGGITLVKDSDDKLITVSIEGLQIVGSRYIILSLKALAPFNYQAGQFTQVVFEDQLGSFRKYYSIASAPRADGRFDLCLQLDDTRLRSWAMEQTLGRTLSVAAPSGRFFLPPPEQPVVMIAGGSGVTPLRAILEARAQQREAAPSTLLYGCKTDQEIPFYDSLQALQVTSPKIHVHFFADDIALGRARLGRPLDALPEFVKAGDTYLLCGPPAFMSGAQKILQDSGVNPEKIHQDRF